MEYPRLILASSSPRRREILTGLGVEFKIALPTPAPNEEAIMQMHRTVPEQVMAVATAKALPVSQKYPEELVLGCDTTVVLEGRVFGKPVNREHAEAMLRELSGHKHQVISAIALFRQSDSIQLVDYATTEVQFYSLSDDEISRYILLEQPFDKAGAYAAQSHSELIIQGIFGDFTNVIGLPVSLLRKMLDKINSITK